MFIFLIKSGVIIICNDFLSSGTTSGRRVVSLSSFEHFMASFLLSIRVQTMKKSGLFVFYNSTKLFFSGISFIFRCKIVKTKRARVALQIASFSWTILSSSIALIQSARRIQTVIV